MPQRGREQRHEGEPEHDQRDRQVDEGHDREDQQRREQRDQELRQELAEIGLELLDAVDHRQGQSARALTANGARSERGDLVVERAPQRLLHPRGVLVRDDRAPVLGGAAQHHDRCNRQDRRLEAPDVAAGEDLPDQPTEQAEPGDAQSDRQKAERDGGGNAEANAFCEDEKARFDVHDGRLGRTFLFVSPQFGKPSVQF